jgi:hypothetical protein
MIWLDGYGTAPAGVYNRVERFGRGGRFRSPLSRLGGYRPLMHHGGSDGMVAAKNTIDISGCGVVGRLGGGGRRLAVSSHQFTGDGIIPFAIQFYEVFAVHLDLSPSTLPKTLLLVIVLFCTP